MGHSGEQAPREGLRAAAGAREDRLRRRHARAACPICSTSGPSRRSRTVGADCIKILLYYAPSDPQKINDHKHAWVERIGDECRANDIPFFLEFIGYEEGIDEKGLEFAKKKPRARRPPACAEFTKDRYGVDVLKVEVPINMKFVEGTKSLARRSRLHEAARRWTRSARRPRSSTKPFIYLSAGVSNAEFTETLELAAESGTRFSGRALRPRHVEGRHRRSTRSRARTRSAQWLETEGVEEHQRTSTSGSKAAHPWYEFYGAKSADALA